MNWLTAFSWAVALLCLVCGVFAVVNLRRQLRAHKRLQAYWATVAPPVDPVDVVLKTGETLTVKPTNVHQAWVWEIEIPVNHNQIDELVIPVLPPYTSVVPIPREWKP
jgi:hypothetical protein